MAGAASAHTSGFHRTAAGLGIYVNGVLLGSSTASSVGLPVASTGALASTTTISAGSAVATTTLTVGTGLTVTTGNSVNTAGDERVTAGNFRLGAIETFAMTEPTSAVVMKTGTAPVGTITTSGGLFSTSTVIFKIVAGGTADNVGTA